MQSEKGSATVPVALFGVSPNRGCGRFHSPFGAPGECCQLVGGTPTGAVETTALPIFNCIVRKNDTAPQTPSPCAAGRTAIREKLLQCVNFCTTLLPEHRKSCFGRTCCLRF